ncbi:uncharacterized protein F4807DRAFT_453144 [Annulohypoxylon truncatum]|uniref:uncharacterized protein n=1 Tax=Annulohypoxylon truncatum TaxID=327061 RepID=UPI002007595D|nr:uncharacterized protein F4807DRAFT_453144 [Annulohypoxylon truncatum]KAI1207090.1 hypothetical protein F4807DRAFT_453144 [Annulohypoxylon truncatum]
MTRRRDTDYSTHTASTRDTRRSADSYDSRSTAPTSLYDSPRPSTKDSDSRAARLQSGFYEEDLPSSTSIYPRSSVDTYSSQASSEDYEDDLESEECQYFSDIPQLPAYRHEIEDINVRPSTPEDFASLFPSMNRLTIRHDDFTSDGNMNLRVDTVVTGRRKKTIQLFHLRMYDLNKREFSLRRYCRDSGREICNSKRKYVDTARPNLQRSVSTAVKSLTRRPTLSRIPTSGSVFSSKSRPGTSHSAAVEVDDVFSNTLTRADSIESKKEKPRPTATNMIKLEFSNYARVDVVRRGNRNTKRYEFEWWGHKYSWKRVVDKLTDSVSYHLLRDGQNHSPVAHIVPETRSPNQVEADEEAGGWVPPCHMWISDPELVKAVTDVADVVVATGLMALVDDCIKERWQTKKVRKIGIPLMSRSLDVEVVSPKTFMQHMFTRRNSEHHPSPLRFHQRPVAAY